MKKLLTIFLISLTWNTYSQKDNYISFSVGLDAKNALFGSAPTKNKPAFNYLYHFAMVSNNYEVHLGYEVFNKLQSNKYLVGFGYHIPLYANVFNSCLKTTFMPVIEPAIINRWGTWAGGISYSKSSSHLTIGVSFGFRWDLNRKWALEYCYQAVPRVDLSAEYNEESTQGRLSIAGTPIVGSDFIKIVYMIKK